MILLSSPLKNDPQETTESIFVFLETEIFTPKIINSKSLKKICRQLLSTMHVLKITCQAEGTFKVNTQHHKPILSSVLHFYRRLRKKLSYLSD